MRMSETTTEELTAEERKARPLAARAQRRASAVTSTGTQRLVLFLDPQMQTRVELLAMSTGRSDIEEAATAIELFLKAPNQAKAIAAQKEAMKSKLEAGKDRRRRVRQAPRPDREPLTHQSMPPGSHQSRGAFICPRGDTPV